MEPGATVERPLTRSRNGQAIATMVTILDCPEVRAAQPIIGKPKREPGTFISGRSGRRQGAAFAALAGVQRIVFDADLGQVPEHSAKHWRKSSGDVQDVGANAG